MCAFTQHGDSYFAGIQQASFGPVLTSTLRLLKSSLVTSNTTYGVLTNQTLPPSLGSEVFWVPYSRQICLRRQSPLLVVNDDPIEG